MPFSTAGTNWRGMDPPKMSSTNSKSEPRASGSTLILQSPNWPCPPVCFLWRPCASVAALIVSRYGMRGGFKLTSTPNRRHAEVGDHRVRSAAQHVARLDVAVDHAAGVRVGERVRHVVQDPHDFAQCEGLLRA